jgi:hypothetical protein
MKNVFLLVLVLMALAVTRVAAAEGGYLFVTFKGEASPMTEQVYFALSPDGRKWEALGGAEPALVSELGEKGVRDPFILRSHDGKKTFLIATDLSINRNRSWQRAQRSGSKSIVVWESTDLVKWSEPRLVRVAPDDAGSTWAPEAVYDEEKGDYLVFWASRNARDNFAKHRIWAARTKDFVAFGEPFVYIDAEHDVIDTTIVRENGVYYRFTKNEKNNAILLDTSRNLMGPWAEAPQFSLAKLRGYEGPTLFRQEAADGKPGSWLLLLDYYSRGQGYQPYVSNDLAGAQFAPDKEFSTPYRFRHGSVLPVTAEEYARLKAAYPTPPAK